MPGQSGKKKAVENDPADATGNRSVPQTTERKIPGEGSFRKAHQGEQHSRDNNEPGEKNSAGEQDAVGKKL